jgi:HEXXH motif-containing protein
MTWKPPKHDPEMFLATLNDSEWEQAQVALRGPGPFWLNNLGPMLARAHWSKLKTEYGLDKSSYGTGRILERDPLAERQIIGHVHGPVIEDQHQIAIESLRPEIARRYRDLGLDFYLPADLNSNFLDMLSRAIRLISAVQGAAAAVSSVLSVLHILIPESPEYDVSYSEPSVPFSIFIGMTLDDQLHRDLRLAEGILHECMHLQLTLVEEQISLIAAENERHRSPWRQTFRPTRGVLHALYVFRVIHDFFADLILSVNVSDEERKYIRRRLSEISNEVEQVGDLSESQDLTPLGRAFVTRLLIGHR